jgi:hypothetical protein
LDKNIQAYANPFIKITWRHIVSAYGLDKMALLENLHISKWRRGNLVQIRPFEEIKKTLDDTGQLDGLPFMPEMLQYCGKRFKISNRTNYICVDEDQMRGLEDTFILQGMYCDGAFHDGCQKSCTIFWKKAWLKPVSLHSGSSDLNKKLNDFKSTLKTFDEISHKYICQSTQVVASSCLLTPLRKIKFLIKEMFSHNQRLDKFILNFCRFIHYKLRKNSQKSYCRLLRGKAEKSPRASLELKAGDWVEIKNIAEIVDTLDIYGKNHGLVFTSEMHHFCGKRYKVRQRLDKMISETTGQMVTLKDTVLLDGVNCFGTCKFGCSRHLFHYWREIWLIKIE